MEKNEQYYIELIKEIKLKRETERIRKEFNELTKLNQLDNLIKKN